MRHLQYVSAPRGHLQGVVITKVYKPTCQCTCHKGSTTERMRCLIYLFTLILFLLNPQSFHINLSYSNLTMAQMGRNT